MIAAALETHLPSGIIASITATAIYCTSGSRRLRSGAWLHRSRKIATLSCCHQPPPQKGRHRGSFEYPTFAVSAKSTLPASSWPRWRCFTKDRKYKIVVMVKRTGNRQNSSVLMRSIMLPSASRCVLRNKCCRQPKSSKH